MLIRPRSYRPTKILNGLTCWMNFANSTISGIGTIFGNTQGAAQRVVDFAGRPAYKFDGTSAWINLSADPLASKATNGVDFCACCWAYIPSNSLRGTILNDGSAAGNSGNGEGWGFGIGSGNYDTNGNNLIGLSAGVAFIDIGVAIGTGWHHLAFGRRSDKEWFGFIDSVSTDSTHNFDMTVARTGATIGLESNNFPRYCPNGVIISDARFYNRLLSSLEFRIIMSEAYGTAIDVETIALMQSAGGSSFLAAWANQRNTLFDGVAT